VVVAEHLPTAGQGLLKEVAGAGDVAEVPAGQGKVVHRGERVGVVVAEHPPAGGQGLIVQLAGAGEVAAVSVDLGELVH
jgi:hypothetical protein